MAKYSDIKGFTVQTLSTDTVASQAEGGSWSSGGNINTARYGGGSSGVTTAGLVYTGRTPPYVTNTESYDGSSWTETTDVNSASYAGAGSPAGSYTAALKTSGKSGPSSVQANTEQWDGTNWTEVSDVNTARDGIMGAGTSTSNIIAGGGQGPPYPVIAESWNGTSWTEVSDLNTAKGVNVSWGTSNSNAIVTTGEPGYGTTTEIWNGSSWTETTDVNNGRTQGGGFGSTSTDGILTGGYYGPGYQSSTESWNGTTWTEVNDMSTARGFHFSSGASSATGFVSSGAPHPLSSTEEWDAPAVFNQITQGQLFFNSTANAFKETILDIPATSWSSGGSLNTARGFSSGAGTQTAALCISGGPGNRANVEQYNGSSWTETTDVNADRLEAGAFGGYTSANYVGGYDPGPANRIASNESWNGSSWTEVNDLPTATDNLMQGAGTQTAGMIVGGVIPTPVKTTNNIFYDGTNWTASSSLNSGRALGAVSGSQTSALVSTGLTGPPSSPSPTTNTANVETWDGSSWTEVSNVNTQRYRVVGSGDAGSGLIFAGTNYPSTAMSAKTESWNGTSWSEINDLSTAREAGSTTSGTGSTAASTLLAGGTTPSVQSATEEWTSDLANKTITAS